MELIYMSSTGHNNVSNNILIDEKVLLFLKYSLGQYGKPYIWQLFIENSDLKDLYVLHIQQ